MSEALRTNVVEAALKFCELVAESKPIAERINMLPEWARKYIHDVEAKCDPAGDIRTISELCDTIRALEAALSLSAPEREALVQHMVNRFLQWRLPENFNPDGGISFKKAINEQLPTWPQKNEPTGTNLLDATQAEEMVRYMLSESPSESAPAPEGATREKIAEEIYDLFGMVTQMHPADGRDKAYSKSDREELLKILAKLPAPEGMGRDVKICTCSHRQERHNKSGCQDCTSCEFFVSAHPTSESGTEDSRPYPDATVMRSRLQLLSFLITGNDYAFFSANPAIQESLKCYSERVIEDWQAKAESGRVEER